VSEGLGDARMDRVLGLAVDPQRERDVLVDREVRQQLEVLEDQADLPPVARKLAALHPAELNPVDEDLALAWLLLPDEEPHQGRLARARRTDQEYEVSFGDDQVDVAESFSSSRIRLEDVLEADYGPGIEIWCQNHKVRLLL